MRKYNVNNKYIIKAKSYVDAVNVVKKLKDTKLKDNLQDDVLTILKNNKIEVIKTTGIDSNFYVYFRDLDTQKRAEALLKNKYNVDRMRDSSGLYKIRIQSDLRKNTGYDYQLKEVENAINRLGYKVIAWNFHTDEITARVIVPNNQWPKTYRSDLKTLSKYAKNVYTDDDEIVFNYPKFHDSLKDDESDIEFLSKEEKQAIEDYKKAISNTNDLKLLRLFAHILKEEIEHLEELRNEEIEDTLKDKKPTDYKALAKELQQKFHTKFVYDPDLGGIEAPYVWGNWKLDQEIVKYLKSKGYKVEWDSIGDDGFYYFKDSAHDSMLEFINNGFISQKDKTWYEAHGINRIKHEGANSSKLKVQLYGNIKDLQNIIKLKGLKSSEYTLYDEEILH